MISDFFLLADILVAARALTFVLAALVGPVGVSGAGPVPLLERRFSLSALSTPLVAAVSGVQILLAILALVAGSMSIGPDNVNE